MRKTHLPHKPSPLGARLARCTPPRWLFPLYNARQLTLDRQTVSAPATLHGLRIAYASDIHYGALLDAQRVCDLAERLNALDADLILLGGDYGEDAETALRFWQIVPDLHARYAVCAALGNHDRAEGSAEAFIQAMTARGVTPLVNSALALTINGTKLAVCATDDVSFGAPDYAATAASSQGADYVIYIPHAPDALEDAYSIVDPPFFNLAICGHSHGGQIAPFGLALHTSTRRSWCYGFRYRSGRVEEHGVTVLISNGVGTTWLPLRIGAPAQYHLITLES